MKACARSASPRLRWMIVAVYAAAIFIQSTLPPAIGEPTWPGADKLMHLGAYALLAALICPALAGYPLSKQGTLPIAVTAAILSALFGVTDELHQALVPERCADAADWIADLAGSIAGATLWAARHRRKSQI